MLAESTSAAASRAQRAALKKKYEPKAKPKPVPKAVSPAEEKLRRLTAQVLDALKLPGAIPSNIILDALKRAREL